MTHVPRAELLQQLDGADSDSARVVDTESMTVGLKRYREGPANEKGLREHTEDELYYILDGSGTIAVGDAVHSVAPGDVLYVEKGTSHDVREVDKALTVLKVLAE